jgi:hypothetical protein
VWANIQANMTSTTQSKSMVLLTGVSGAGKTKVAFDIGRPHAFMVLIRVWEKLMTPQWQLLHDITSRLQAQSVCGVGAGAAPLAVSESTSAVACLLLLLSCHLEWALMVHEAASAAAARADAFADGTVLREAVLRAQRNGAGHNNVRALFARRLQDVLDSRSNITADGRVMVPVAAALARVQLLRSAMPTETTLVWCYDEVQALLAPFDGFFADSLTRQLSRTPALQLLTHQQQRRTQPLILWLRHQRAEIGPHVGPFPRTLPLALHG